MAHFFIHRPIFAWVIALVIMLAGILTLSKMPIAQYPTIAPPTVSISAVYPGASAETVENTVTQIIEQQINGLDGLRYISSNSAGNGAASISVNFEQGVDPDIAQVQVQNKLQSATALLPEDVQRQGLKVTKSGASFLQVIAFYSPDNSLTDADIKDYVNSNISEVLSRVAGVGEVQVFGGSYAMRIWLDPAKLASYKLSPSDVVTALRTQNSQVAVGQLGGAPTVEGQVLNATVNAQSLLQTPEQFRGIFLKTAGSGAKVTLGDVAKVELGSDNYQFTSKFNGKPSAGVAIKLATGANALDTAAGIEARLKELRPNYPTGLVDKLAFDTTPFIKLSIESVVHTLIEAIILVFLVMFLFLQNWRATIIPTMAVPVVVLGTFAVINLFGFSINTLTMFAMVLAIGLLVDDAIVVVENVERIMHEQNLTAKQAALASMQEMTGALIGITVVLTAVFIPMAFFTGSTGVIYRQFSITLVAAMSLSLLVALILTPALCALILKPSKQQPQQWALWFNQNMECLKQQYLTLVQKTLNFKWVILLLLVGLISVFALIYRTLPTSFIPSEDQAILSVQFRLADGAPMSSSLSVGESIRKYFLEQEKQNVDIVLIRYGRNFSGTGQNLGTGFIALKHWDKRAGDKNSAQAIRERAIQYFNKNPNAKISVMMPSSVNGLGDSDSLEFWLQDINGQGRQYLDQQFKLLKTEADQFKTFENLDKKSNPDKARLQLDIDQKLALANGLTQTAINSTLSAAWGGSYINDFIDRGRIKRVIMQGDAQFRSQPQDLQAWTVRNSQNQMIPFSNFTQAKWSGGPDVVNRFQGYTALQMEANAAKHVSSGQAMQDIQTMVSRHEGVDVAWSGLSFQEQKSSRQAIWLYLISVGFIFLCLAALYESWSIPTVVIAAIPLGIGGNIIFSWLTGFPNDIYFQIALLTTIGLSCKNAILIVEFAALAQQKGQTAIAAALQGAGLRLRPILMTSLAFGAGVIPLVLASGAGAASRQEIGVSVLGGVIFGTLLVLIFIPFMYVLVRSLFRSKDKTDIA